METAQEKFDRLQRQSLREASGYLELAMEAQKLGLDTTKLLDAAIKSLDKLTNDDDLLDQLQHEDNIENNHYQ